MKRLLAAAAIWIAASVAPAAAATTLAVWEGYLYIDSVVETPAGVCTSGDGPGAGFNTGFFASAFHTVFKPAGLVNNGPDTKMLMVTNRSAVHYLWKNKAFGNGANAGNGFGGTANIFTFTSVFAATSLSPAHPTANTQTVVLKATITNFFGNTGCTVKLVGSLSKRPHTSY